MGFKDALLIGCAQILALIPGTSRSGVTMTAARLLGLQRAEAARFSFLLSIPAILAAGSLVTLEVMGGEGEGLGASAILGLLAPLSQRMGRDRLPDAVASPGKLHALRDLPADPRRRPFDLRLYVELTGAASSSTCRNLLWRRTSVDSAP